MCCISLTTFADVIDDALEQAQLGKFNEAVEIISPLAESGNAEAQYYLAKLYMFPDALNEPELGMEWMTKSAYNDNPTAQFFLAMLVCNGWITETIENIVECVYWLERSLDAGNDKALPYLGVLYENEHWDLIPRMKTLAEQGNAKAYYNLGMIYGRGLMRSDEFIYDPELARHYIEKGAELWLDAARDFLKKLDNEK